MNGLVSILIPVFNRGSIISETIRSALAQTYNNIEVVVVDNASSDNTWDIIQNFAARDPRIKAFRNDSNQGPVRNWVRCVEEATGEYGKILWSDDLISIDFLEKTIPLFSSDVGFVYTGVKIFSGASPLEGECSCLLAKSGYYPSSYYINKALYDKGVPVSPGCAVFRMADLRKNLWVQIPNKIGSDFSVHAIGNDLLLFLLTAKDYKYFGHISEPLAFFRAHAGSITISSIGGKIPLHYALAKAYYIENFASALKPCFAAYLKFLLWRYRDSKAYGLTAVNDFFRDQVHVSRSCLLLGFIARVHKIVPRIFLRISKRIANGSKRSDRN